MNTFKLRILAADSPFFEGECESLIVPTIRGMRGIWANHSEMMSAIVPGKITFRLPGGEEREAFVEEGAIKVEHNEALLLVDSAIKPEDMEAEMQRRKEAEEKEALLQKQGIQEYKLAQAKMAKEMSKLKIKNREMR